MIGVWECNHCVELQFSTVHECLVMGLFTVYRLSGEFRKFSELIYMVLCMSDHGSIVQISMLMWMQMGGANGFGTSRHAHTI